MNHHHRAITSDRSTWSLTGANLNFSICADNSHAAVLKQMKDDCYRFEIVLACHSQRTEEVGEDISARSLLSRGPDIAAPLHFIFDDCAPTLFRADFIASVFLSLRARQNPHTKIPMGA
jgi:hypothetical protein